MNLIRLGSCVLAWLVVSAVSTLAAAEGAKNFVDNILSTIVADKSRDEETRYLETSLLRVFNRLAADKKCAGLPGLGARLMGGQDHDFKAFASTVARENRATALGRVTFVKLKRPVIMSSSLKSNKIPGRYMISAIRMALLAEIATAQRLCGQNVSRNRAFAAPA